MNGLSEKELVWPPAKEDLGRLYLDERLSAMKIAQRYGLRYASPKTAESTVLYHLKRAGIRRRDCADHVRNVTEEMADEWVKRYEAGESLKQIAGASVDHVTVFNHLRRRGVQLRDKVEAQIKAVTRHTKRAFEGDEGETSYLLGLTQGDLYVNAHGRLVRIKTSTTHPDMAGLFKACFQEYGPIYMLPKKSTLGYEWTLTADLDQSFGFLLKKQVGIPEYVFGKKRFLHYLGGIFDAEGSIFMNAAGWFELSISNEDRALLGAIQSRLHGLDVHSRQIRSGPTRLAPESEVWQLRIWRRNDVRQLLMMLLLRHPEKVRKKTIALKMYEPFAWKDTDLLEEWECERRAIKQGRDGFVRDAEESFMSRSKTGSAGA